MAAAPFFVLMAGGGRNPRQEEKTRLKRKYTALGRCCKIGQHKRKVFNALAWWIATPAMFCALTKFSVRGLRSASTAHT